MAPVVNPPEFGRPRTALRIVERRAAYAVITDDAGRVLVVRTERGLFLPGGGVEPGEAPAQGLDREIGEELCFSLTSSAHRASAIQHFVADGVSYRMTADFFVASLGSRRAGAPEHEALWIDPSGDNDWYHACHEWAARMLADEITHDSRGDSVQALEGRSVEVERPRAER